MKRDIRNTTTFLIAFFILHVNSQTLDHFDPDKHFIKGIAFLLKSDSLTNIKDTVFVDISYEAKTLTDWNYINKRWETGTYFRAVLKNFNGQELLSKIDSVFLEKNIPLRLLQFLSSLLEESNILS
ncbi:MAG: hypothetical protein V4635_04060 [Bacteroidota bacterium]